MLLAQLAQVGVKAMVESAVTDYQVGLEVERQAQRVEVA